MPPSFLQPDFLLTHIADTMRFYHPRCIDHSGGFFHFFKDDGAVYDRETRHLVSSTRFVFNYAMAHRYFPNDEYADAIRHGLAFLRQATITATVWPLCCWRIRMRWRPASRKRAPG
jgi:mannose/cellobiose epimerase-like protein (N-acyl-D-glucosamine 2-epimerase family)